MPIKSTIKCDLTWARMVIAKAYTNYKYWRECGEKTALLYCWRKFELMQALWRTVWRFLMRLEIDHIILYDPQVTSGSIPIRDENSNSKTYMYPNIHRSTIHSSQDTEVNTNNNICNIFYSILLYIIYCNIK